MNIVTVYHGGVEVVESPDVRIGRSFLDFGRGFYVTDFKAQAVQWARHVGFDRKRPGLVNVYRLDKAAILKEARCKIFTAYNREWLRFIVANRSGEDVAAAYDFIEGGIANDRVINTITLFLQGYCDEDFALGRLAEHRPNNQMCLRRQELIDRFLRYEGTEDA